MRRMITKLFLPVLLGLGLMVAGTARADIGVRSTGDDSVRKYTIHFTADDAVNAISDPIPSCLAMTVFWDRGVNAAVSLFEVDPADDTVAEVEASTNIKAFTITTKFGKFSPIKSAVRFVVDTAETGAPSSAVIMCSNVQLAAAGQDLDNNGLYETAVLWDADGDGSVNVLCTAATVPDVACKVAGEVIYRDFADDINCAVHGCGLGQMEKNGTILLESIVYVNFPCWDAAERTGFNDPAATDDNLRDNVADVAYTRDCPATPDSGTTRRFINVAFMGWQGSVIGQGYDTRDPEHTTGYKRDNGTYIVDDRGPAHGGEGNNLWFGSDGFIRGIGFGFQATHVTNGATPVQSGETANEGDANGWGVISGDQDISEMNGQVCVADTSTGGAVSGDGWAQALAIGDMIAIEGTSMSTGSENRTNFVYRVRDVPGSGTCDGDGTVNIPLGGRVTGGTVANFSSNMALTQAANDGRFAHAVRSDMFDSATSLSNVTLEPQDWWNETGGRCAGAGVWTVALDNAEADFDCDTNPFVGFWGPGRPLIHDVAIRHWHDRSIDGASNPGSPILKTVYFLYGNGGSVSDPGYGWRFEDIEIRNSQFSLGIFGSFGPGVELDRIRVVNSSFERFMRWADGSMYNTVENLSIVSSAFARVFQIDCGAQFNRVTNLIITGHQDQAGTDQNGVVARIICNDTANPVQYNYFSGVRMSGPGASSGGTGGSNCAIVMDTDTIDATDKSPAIANNHFENFFYEEVDNNIEASLFCAQDDTAGDPGAGGSREFENVLHLNTFSNSIVVNTGTGTDAQVYRGCGRDAATHVCDDAIEGDASSGVASDPRGCLNKANGVNPAIEICN